jgi:hypothetical protein
MKQFVLPCIGKFLTNDRYQRSMVQICGEVVVDARVICTTVNRYLQVNYGLLPSSTFQRRLSTCIFCTRSKLAVDQAPACGKYVFLPKFRIAKDLE